MHLRQRVRPVGIESDRHQHDIWLEAAQGRREYLLGYRAVRLVAAPAGQWNVNGRTGPVILSNVLDASSARVKRVLMRRVIEYVRATEEDVLGAIAVVDVDVQHRHTLCPAFVNCPISSDCHVIEETES